MASSVTAASEWDVDGLTDLQKQWTITFNEPVELQRIEKNTIVIRNEFGNVVHATLIQHTPNELIVDVGENMYDIEHTYTLTIAPFASSAGNMLNEAVTTKSWLIIMLHNVVDEPIVGCANGEAECDELYDISTANLEELMAYIASFSREQLLPVNTYEGVQMASSWIE